MNRIAGIILAAVGFIVALLGVLKVVPGITGSGVMLIIVGGLIIGLSFIDSPEAGDAERMSTPSSLVNIFFSPSEVFRNLRTHPRWLVALLLMSVMSATYYNLFMTRMTPERVTNYAIDKTLELPMMNDQAREQIEKNRPTAIAESKSPVVRASTAVTGFGWSVIGYAFLALIFMLFAMAMGGKLGYLQAFAVAVYAAFPVNLIRFILNTVLLFVKDPTDIHPITGQNSLIQDNLSFLFVPAEHPVLYTLMGTLSLLSFYWVWLSATGLQNGGEKVSGTVSWTAVGSVYFLMIVMATTMAFMFPGFIS